MSLKKIGRCAEVIQNSTLKLLQNSNSENGNSGSQDSQSECSETSVLSDVQSEQMDVAAQEVKLATQTLIGVVKAQLKSDTSPSPGKGKRMLPLSPTESARLTGASRSRSSLGRIRRNISLLDASGDADS